MTNTWINTRHHNMVIGPKRLRRLKHAVARKKVRYRQKQWFQDHYESLRDPETHLFPIHITAPAAFIIQHEVPRKEFLGFISRIRKAVLEEKRVVYVDFSETQAMASDATLLLYAELMLLNGITKKKMVRCSCATSKANILASRATTVTQQALQHVGIFDALGKRGRSRVVHHSVKHWHSAAGIEVEGEKIGPLTEFYTAKLTKGSIAPRLNRKGLYNSMIEAMTNSVQHAYSEDEPEKWWWMLSEERENELTVVMCDQGIGIPASLKKGKWDDNIIMNTLSRYGLTETHGALILAAFEVGKSRTEEKYRGKGLQQVRHVLDALGGGSLIVHSGRGLYQYAPNTAEKSPKNFDDEVRGTLITWKLPLPKGMDTVQLSTDNSALTVSE